MKLVRSACYMDVVETQRHLIVYAALSVLFGLVAVAFGLYLVHLLAFILVGLLFIITGLFMGQMAETKTTQLKSDGTISIEYKRILGRKRWVRKLNRSNILKIDHVKGHIAGSGWLMSSVYLSLDSNEQVEIGSRIEKNSVWTIDTEVSDVATFLKVPVNVIQSLNVKSSIKNFYNPKDKMRTILQRPTQQQLDQEYAENLATKQILQPQDRT